MQIYGIDFTSRPNRKKPIVCARCELQSTRLVLRGFSTLTSLDEFSAFLETAGPWAAGIDFPFGQSRRFIENIGWPRSWAGYVSHVSRQSRAEFRQALDAYRAPRAAGDKEHRRLADRATGAISPQKLYGVPVGLMFFAGAKRLLESGARLPGLHEGDPGRVVFEAYPGVLARRVTRSGYKNDDRSKQTPQHREARQRIVEYLQGDEIPGIYGLNVRLAAPLPDDPTGDVLDSLLCAVQAGWAWHNRHELVAALTADHQLEGWIADPAAMETGSD